MFNQNLSGWEILLKKVGEVALFFLFFLRNLLLFFFFSFLVPSTLARGFGDRKSQIYF